MFKLEIEFKDGRKEIIDNVANYDWDESAGLLCYCKDDVWNYDIKIAEIARFEAFEV